MVGGAYMAMLGLRDSTHDVDSVTKLTPALRRATRQTALEHGLSTGWLNDRASAFAPIGLQEATDIVLFRAEGLSVVGPHADAVFMMKLLSAREVDHKDMIALWPRCTWASADEATSSFAKAYPNEPSDPHLVDYVRSIAAAAAATPDHLN